MLQRTPDSPSEPIFNIPWIVMLLSVAMALVHGVRAFFDEKTDLETLLWFAFLPARYGSRVPLPGGEAADAWTFVTYAFLHGDVTHLIVNLVWFLAFGSAVAWRFGAIRFSIFFAITAAAGALAHLITNYGTIAPLVGASAAISGMMAAALRFAFEDGGPLGMFRGKGQAAFLVPAAPLLQAFKNRQVLIFTGIWFFMNIAFGLGSIPILGENSVAWEAHIGGFIAGLLLFPLFDPVDSRRN
jgi:membrane associated rhomboid family serine protease